jgi:formylglycine-generating enzyme required for sulfatase activity
LSQGFIYSGSKLLSHVGWYRENSRGAPVTLDNTDRGTWPVGQKAANELGLHDMSGNVNEWCWDAVTLNDGTLTSNRRNRGGDWTMFAHQCAVDVRNHDLASDRDDFSKTFGFRLAR